MGDFSGEFQPFQPITGYNPKTALPWSRLSSNWGHHAVVQAESSLVGHDHGPIQPSQKCGTCLWLVLDIWLSRSESESYRNLIGL